MSEAHSPIGYVKIWAILLVLLLISIFGPMLEIPILTLITAFGIAVVKALIVAKYFMHMDEEKRIVWQILGAMVVMVGLFFFGVAADAMKPSGQNWINKAAIEQIEKHKKAAGAAHAPEH